MMKIKMESTEHVVSIDGVECRIWNAVTENNTACFVFVHRIAVRDGFEFDQSEWTELLGRPEPGEAASL
jgi:hypothetical protein